MLNTFADNKKKPIDDEKIHDNCSLDEAEKIYFENNGNLTIIFNNSAFPEIYYA